MSWYDMQKQGQLFQSENLEKLDLKDLVRDIELYPVVRQAFITLLTLPATTCTVKRSFSTLRRVKTWKERPCLVTDYPGVLDECP